MSHTISKPSNTTFKNSSGTGKLTWSTAFAATRTAQFNKAQQYIDSEVLRYCSPKVPFDTGALDKSGTLATEIGSGEVRYNAVYARYQYYATSETRSYDADRGGKWFDRMKAENGDDILNGAKKIMAG